MADQGLINETPYAAQELYLADEEGRDLAAVVVKATYAIRPDGTLEQAEEQVPVDLAGTYYGDPETSSMQFEPEVAFVKPATDLVLIGHAYPDRPGARHVDVGFQVGGVRKVARVFGDRVWTTSLGFARITEAVPFERMPLQWERAFGGWDRTATDPEKHSVEPRNPVGVGFRAGRLAMPLEGAPLPNIEDPKHLIRDVSDTPPPAGFGFVGPYWMPRLRYAGTYGEAWERTRMPLLPQDFDRRFFNAAPPDQVVPGLRGDETITVANASPGRWLQFRLPAVPAPVVTVVRRKMEDELLMLRLDTVVVDTDAMQVLLLWRAHMLIPAGPHSVTAIHVDPRERAVHVAVPAEPAFSS